MAGGIGSIPEHTFASGADLWNPTKIPNLLVWLRADGLLLSSGNAVDSWSDESGNGNNFVQATAGSQPTWEPAIQNGLPVVRFDGVNDFLQNTGSLDLSSECTIFVAIQIVDATANQALVSKGVGDLAFLQWTGGAGAGANMSESNVALMTGEGVNGSTSWQIYCYRWDGTLGLDSLASIYRNGDTVAGPSTYDEAGIVNASALDIGEDSGAGDLNGDIGEILIYQRLLSTGDQRRVEQYLSSRWNITLV